MLGTFLLASLQAVADPSGIGLGSWSTQVAALMPSKPKIEKARSLESDETWKYDSGVEIFFCHGRVTSVHIPMVNTLRAWAAAVAKEQMERGPAHLDAGMAALGTVGARWRLAGGGYLSLEIQDVGNTLIASRWLDADVTCS